MHKERHRNSIHVPVHHDDGGQQELHNKYLCMLIKISHRAFNQLKSITGPIKRIFWHLGIVGAMCGINVHVPPMPIFNQQLPLLGSHKANQEI